jgi:hypothetical protein
MDNNGIRYMGVRICRLNAYARVEWAMIVRVAKVLHEP